MPRFDANCSMLFAEAPFLDRFERAAKAGFTAVEFLFPYAHAPAEIADRLDANGLSAVLFNTPPGDSDAGERGMACIPGRETEFRDSVRHAVDYARALGVGNVHVLAGLLPRGIARAVAHRTYVENLRFAAAQFAPIGVRALIEPINAFDMPDYFLHRNADALAIIDEVAAPNLLLQFDLYHAQRSEGELAATIARLLPKIGHMQIADNPGRHEPGSGEINFPFLFAHIDRLGYAGHVGCEYRPLGTTEAGLGWLHAAQSLPAR
jgi:hydroxypyruvate isomerase